MNITKKLLSEIKGNRELKKQILVITMLAIIFALALLLKPNDLKGKYLVNNAGDVVGIERGTLKEREKFNLNLVIDDGKNKEERHIEINKQAVNRDGKRKKIEKNNEAAEKEAEISSIITDIELSERKTISLPNHLSDGSKLIWSVYDEISTTFLFIPIAYILLVFLAIKSSLDNKNKDEKSNRTDILKGLPRFTNQLLLMMNAGMILSDAFDRIAKSYSLIDVESRNFFEKELISIATQNQDHRVSTATLINGWANKYSVKELMRISTILTENEKRGSNVIDNLSRESRYLWDDRKIIAREAGKMIDTKMSYPMGLLLLLLIVITMAPAMMNL